jgi:hypothetical protein
VARIKLGIGVNKIRLTIMVGAFWNVRGVEQNGWIILSLRFY